MLKTKRPPLAARTREALLVVPPHFAAAIGVAAALRPANGGDPAGLTCGSSGGIGRAVRAFFPALRRVFAVPRGRLPSIGGSLCPRMAATQLHQRLCPAAYQRRAAASIGQKSGARQSGLGVRNHEDTKARRFLVYGRTRAKKGLRAEHTQPFSSFTLLRSASFKQPKPC